MQKLTKRLFEIKARNLYKFPEYDYDYSKTEFQKSTDKINVYCNKHKIEFQSTSASHFLKGRICPECRKEINNKNQQIKQNQKHIEFLNKCKQKGLDLKYDLSKIEYVTERQPIIIKCLNCGKVYNILPFNFLNENCGCNDCKNIEIKNKKQLEFIEKAQQIHKNSDGTPKYDYSKVKFISVIENVEIICPIHGPFFQTPLVHLNSKYGCKECSIIGRSNNRRLTTEQFIEKAQQIHKNSDSTPKYDYSITEYNGATYYLDIICPIHGKFSQKAETHLQGHGCPECGKESTILKQLKSVEQFIKEAENIHNPIRNYLKLPKYNYSAITKYNGAFEKVSIICPIHGIFFQTPNAHLSKQGCPKCDNSHSSKQEKEILDFIKSIYTGKIIENDRNIISPKEIDIYIPELKLGIEFDGFYYHSGKIKSPTYHLEKTEECEKQGIQLIHIFESEWLNKKEIVKSRLRNLFKFKLKGYRKLHANSSKIYIKQVSIEQEKIFLERNHLQGYANSTICYGLYWKPKDKEYLISIMSFGNIRFGINKNRQNYYELIRYSVANNFLIYEGASKLFNYFVNKFNPEYIISYADRRWSIDSENILYHRLNFILENKSSIGYWYVKNKQLIHRLNFTKQKCIKLGCPEEISEKEFVTEYLGYDIIYDCGQLKYVWTNPNIQNKQNGIK